MYFTSKVDNATGNRRGAVLDQQPFTAKELQTMVRLVLGKIAQRHVLGKLDLVTVKAQPGQVLVGPVPVKCRFVYSPKTARITLTLADGVLFPTDYLGTLVNSAREMLVMGLAYAVMYHHQYGLAKKLKRKRVYSEKQALPVAQQVLQHYRVYALDYDFLEAKAAEVFI